MTLSLEGMDVLRFGEYELRPAGRELRRGDQVVTVQPKAFELLVFLAANRDRAVSKDELLEAVWPGVHVSETALTRCVMKARRAVGDDADRQAVIKTVHGHGYRFVAMPEVAPEAGAAPAAASQDGPRAVAASLSRKFVFFAAAAAFIAAGAVGLFLATQKDAPVSATRVAVLPIANATDDAALDWTSLGLMSFIGHYLEKDFDIAVAPAPSVMKLAGEEAVPLRDALSIEASLVEKLRRTEGVSHVVAARFENSDALLRLTYSVIAPNGVVAERTLVGEEPTVLARQLGQALALRLPGAQTGGGEYRVVSVDPFVNETYARGRDMQLRGRAAEARNLFMVATDYEPENFWLRYEYALSTRMMGELQEAEDILIALSESLGQGDDSAFVAANNALGVVRWRQGDIHAAKAHYLAALERVNGPNAYRRTGAILTNLSIIAGIEGDLDLKRSYLGRASTAFVEAGFEAPPGYLLSSLASLEISSGNFETAEAHLTTALEQFRLLGDKRSEATELDYFGQIRSHEGRYGEAQDFFEQAMTLRQEIDDPMGVSFSHAYLAEVKLAQGQFDAAQAHAQQALLMAREAGKQRHEADMIALLGTLAEEQGDYGNAERRFNESIAISQAINDQREVAELQMRLAKAQLSKGDSGAALRLAPARCEEVGAPNDADVLSACELAGDVYRAEAMTERAIAAYDEALSIATSLGRRASAARIAAKTGHIRLDSEEVAAAASQLGIANEFQPDAVDTLKLGARYAYLSGRRDDALSLMRRAKTRAGQAWRDADEAQLRLYETEDLKAFQNY